MYNKNKYQHINISFIYTQTVVLMAMLVPLMIHNKMQTMKIMVQAASNGIIKLANENDFKKWAEGKSRWI
jgi:hypothetical protein